MSSTSERAFTANVLGCLARSIVDRQDLGMTAVAGRGGSAPAALVTLLWYPDRSIGSLATRLRISHPGAVQLVDGLVRDGLVERVDGADGRSRLLRLTTSGETLAGAVLTQRTRVLERAIADLDEAACHALSTMVSTMLEALADDLLTSEFMCRLCDEGSCPDDRCPVERAEPAPPTRRGRGYGTR